MGARRHACSDVRHGHHRLNQYLDYSTFTVLADIFSFGSSEYPSFLFCQECEWIRISPLEITVVMDISLNIRMRKMYDVFAIVRSYILSELLSGRILSEFFP